MTLAEPLGDTVHAERGLLIVVLSLIRNGKDLMAVTILMRKLYSRCCKMFSANIQKEQLVLRGEDHHEFWLCTHEDFKDICFTRLHARGMIPVLRIEGHCILDWPACCA